MKKHRNRHANFMPLGNETAIPAVANTPSNTEQQNAIASRTNTQNEDPELRSFLHAKLPRRNPPEQLISTFLSKINLII